MSITPSGGAGEILGTGTLVNQANGQIFAAGGTGILYLAVANVLNSGKIEATNNNELYLESPTVTNSANGVIVSGVNSTVVLFTDDVIGGTLDTTQTGIFDAVDTELDGSGGHPVTLNGTLDVYDNVGLVVVGVLNNIGSISLGSTGDLTFIALEGSEVTLEGHGNIILSGFSENSIATSSSLTKLGQLTHLNNDGNTISGAGSINNLILNNAKGSLIDATGAC